MDTEAVRDTGGEMGAARIFGTDVLMTLALLNEARHIALRVGFGATRAQANVLTGVLVLAAADGAYLSVRHKLHHPFGGLGGDAALGALALREVANGIAGPAARQVPGFAGWVTAAVIVGVAVPSINRVLGGVRRAESQIRAQRMRVYNVGRRVER